MVMDLLESVLQEFGHVIHIPNLKADEHHSCEIVLPNKGPRIQLELDKNEEFLVFGCEFSFIPPGRYRENLFKIALQSNSLPPPRTGDFAFSKKAEKLVLFTKIPIKNINGEKVAAIWGPFSEKAILWNHAIKEGEVPALHTSYTTRPSGTGMFGL
jgi:hypothetical protein